MGCQANVDIGNNLTFSICTHDPETGILTDADAAPAYRVYEDETAAPLLTGTMAKLDDANTTGFYTEQIACTAANGFEAGKSYTVYVEATVAGSTGGIAYAFAVGDPNTVADAVLERDMDQVEASAPKHSLASAVLKSVSRVRDNAGVIETYRTDGVTLHMSQTATSDEGLSPISELAAGT